MKLRHCGRWPLFSFKTDVFRAATGRQRVQPAPPRKLTRLSRSMRVGLSKSCILTSCYDWKGWTLGRDPLDGQANSSLSNEMNFQGPGNAWYLVHWDHINLALDIGGQALLVLFIGLQRESLLDSVRWEGLMDFIRSPVPIKQ